MSRSWSTPWDALGDMDTFGTQYWNKCPLQRAVGGFDPSSVLTLSELDRMLTSRHTDARLFQRGGRVDAAEYQERGLRRADERTWLTNPQALFDGFRDGSTIVMPSAHEAWAPIGTLAGDLETLLDAQVGATIFVSPPGSVTDWHVDPGHVFVLQLHGRKHWLIERQRSSERETDLPHMVTVTPGDVLYVPRGLAHRVTGADAPAVHVSFYLSAPSWSDLVQSALASRLGGLPQEDLHGSAVNPRWGTACRAEWTATLHGLLDQVTSEVRQLLRDLPELSFDALAPDRPRRPLGFPDRDGAFLDAYRARCPAAEGDREE